MLPPSEAHPADRKRRVCLITPDFGIDGAWYGGGVGGHGRMAQVMLGHFRSDRIALSPSFHSVRKAGRLYRLHFPWRLLQDTRRVATDGAAADGLHLILQYRSAIVREFAAMAVARVLGRPVLVDIRAGSFAAWYESAAPPARWMTQKIMAWAKVIAVEGVPQVDFVREHFGRAAAYFPNFVPVEELPAAVPEKATGAVLRVLFVGYAYEGKGVQELVEGCRAAAGGVRLALTLAGHEAPAFTAWLDERVRAGLPFPIDRLGVQPHDRILALYDTHDVFAMPSRHPGEGHSNATNEAMTQGMIIVCTRHGFLGSILDEESAYFVEKNDAESIASALRTIDAARDAAREKARQAHRRLRERFTTETRIPQLETLYLRLFEA